ncbi:MAG TPA: zf-HC2 domain-containing protein [Pirellulales bacterium]|nr:zf-HC2 domain-containing protein [Pirellulales bacterium]
MIDPLDEELLTAYLDGELAGDERARVERLLAEQPESRQLLEDLRAIKQRLESLPAGRLDDDFAERVLRQAEREVLSGHDGARTERAPEGFRVQGSGFSKPSADGRQSKIQNLKSKIARPLIWASVAIAAGLLIMFVDRDRQQPRQVAMAPEQAERHDDNDLRARPEIGAAPRGPAAKDETEAMPALQAPSVARNSFRSEGQENGMNSVLREGERSNLSGGRSASSGRRMDERMDENLGKQLAETEQEKELSDQPPMRQRSEPVDAPQIVDDQTLVVWCELSADAPAEESFSQVLAQQNIAWQPVSEDEQLAYMKQAGGEQAKRADFFGYRNGSGEAGAVEVDAAQLADTLQRRGLQRVSKDQTATPVDALQTPGAQMVLVEATNAQVKGVLEALDQDRDTYRAVEVEPAPDAPRQQVLTYYSRGAVLAKSGGRGGAKASLGEKAADADRKSKVAKSETEASEQSGDLSVKNSAADMRLPQGRAMRLQLQQAPRSQPAEPAFEGGISPPPPAPSAPVPPAAKPAEQAEATEAAEAKKPAARERPPEPVYRVLFVLVPPAEAKPAAAAPADQK